MNEDKEDANGNQNDDEEDNKEGKESGDYILFCFIRNYIVYSQANILLILSTPSPPSTKTTTIIITASLHWQKDLFIHIT